MEFAKGIACVGGLLMWYDDMCEQNEKEKKEVK